MRRVAGGESPGAATPSSDALVFPDLLRRRAAEHFDVVTLVVHGGDSLTYGRWHERSSRVARGLVARQVQAGDRVALLFDNARWTDYAVSYLGVHKAGAVAVPLAPRFSPGELARVLEHCGASAIVCPTDLAPESWRGPRWIAATEDLEAGQSGDDLQVALDPGDLAEILYTSGTTGMAKGVACSHANLLFHELPAEQRVAAEPAACFLHSFPIGTNAGQEVLRQTLRRAGTTAVVLTAFDPEQLCAAVVAHGVTRLQLVPAMAQMLLDSAAYRRHDLSSIERVILSSAPLPPALLARLAEAFPNAAFWNAYAMSESGTARTVMVDAGTRPGSVGRPVGRSEVQVVDDLGNPQAVGQTGEVWLRRVGAPRREYYRDPEATEALFAGDWLRTGDLGYLDEDGYLYLVDRKKDVIIRGGSNVSSVTVENVLYEHPAVAEAAVFGVPHEVLGQEVAAAVVVRTPTTARELQAFVRERLAEHGTPHFVFFVDHLPRNASGKVLKRELAPGLWVGESTTPEPGADAVGPSTPDELAVVAVWEEALGKRGIGLHDDFFQLGGHSLSAAQVAAQLSDQLGLTIEPTAVFEAPTIAELVATFDELRSGSGEA